jgi:rhomboid family GlyGly-CTERM serine protease
LTERARRPWQGGRLWLALSLLLVLASLALWPLDAQRWDWQSARAGHEPWRWLSAAAVHWTGAHLLANLFAATLVAAYGWAARVPSVVGWAWLASWPLTHLALLMRPELAHYGGLSGVLHGGVAAVTVWLVLRGRQTQRTIGWMMVIGHGTKLLVEQSWADLLHPTPELGVAVAPLAHATGSLAGALCTLVALRACRAAPST